jgi:hypothetical protein
MKVGDYVRTKDGIIGRIEAKNYLGYNDWLIDTLYYNDDEIINDWTCGIKEYNILKSSPNIIDLIQEGDYINGLRVESNKYGELYTSYVYYGGDIGKQCEVYTTWLKEYKENEDWIESIITKEQFESKQYKVGE